MFVLVGGEEREGRRKGCFRVGRREEMGESGVQ